MPHGAVRDPLPSFAASNQANGVESQSRHAEQERTSNVRVFHGAQASYLKTLSEQAHEPMLSMTNLPRHKLQKR
jgi:hypothetical protein